ncbi:MAG: flagellar hook-length control protein FliK [Alphaproteobacteria bacterium]|nr:flagellar hook-length control protein FliK [Alphaproteobacteria bacterium]
MSLDEPLRNNTTPRTSNAAGTRTQPTSAAKAESIVGDDFATTVERAARQLQQPGENSARVRGDTGPQPRDASGMTTGSPRAHAQGTMSELSSAPDESADELTQTLAAALPEDLAATVAADSYPGRSRQPLSMGGMLAVGNSDASLLIGGRPVSETVAPTTAGADLNASSQETARLRPPTDFPASASRLPSAAVARSEQEMSAPLPTNPAAGNALQDIVRDTVQRWTERPSAKLASPQEYLELKVLHREKHLPVRPLAGPGGGTDPAQQPEEENQPAEPGPMLATRRSAGRATTAASLLQPSNPQSDRTGAAATAMGGGEPVVGADLGQSEDFVQQIARRILSEVATSARVGRVGPSSPAQLNAPVGGNVIRILEVALEPASLGALKVRLSLRGQELSVSLSADTQSALDAINNDRESLEAALKGAGYALDELKIQRADQEFSRTPAQAQDQGLRGDGGNKDWTTGRGGGHAGTSGSAQGGSGDEGTAPERNSDNEHGANTRDVRTGLSGTRSVVV